MDGTLINVVRTFHNISVYPLASGLSKGRKDIKVARRTEAEFGSTTFGGFLADGEISSPPPPNNRKIEWIGDSITCGAGNEGKVPCAFSGATENSFEYFSLPC